MVPTPGTLRPGRPRPRGKKSHQRTPGSDSAEPSRPVEEGAAAGRPARGKSEDGPRPPRHPAHLGQTGDGESDGAHAEDPASPPDPLAAGRKTPPQTHRVQHASQWEIRNRGRRRTTRRRGGGGPARPGQTEDGGSDGAHAGDPPPPDDPVLGENAPPGGPPAPSPAASRSAGQNRLQNPGMAGGRLGSAGGALSARCVEIRRSESPANSRVG
ncbi:cuticle collagen 2-like [Lytechinus variegatus]|uniref:cuticle collagen 2-like n=1 Tax=Lytechinus variegatus TaxID=7654 RepID=UPI001BB1CDDC|nr:cuticle collagen 2-like [Lytechinus variegatus]